MRKRIALNVILIVMLAISIAALVFSISSFIGLIEMYLTAYGYFPKDSISSFFILIVHIITPIFLASLCAILLFRLDGYKLLFCARESFENFVERSKQKKNKKLEKQRKRLEAKLNQIKERQSDE
ncbi:MAG: hypothetical protein IJW48_03615 [Clostridia bacterium]|nr:hypothetical protein [Clostridia bacterium]